jgi:hypothetical protein
VGSFQSFGPLSTDFVRMEGIALVFAIVGVFVQGAESARPRDWAWRSRSPAFPRSPSGADSVRRAAEVAR